MARSEAILRVLYIDGPFVWLGEFTGAGDSLECRAAHQAVLPGEPAAHDLGPFIARANAQGAPVFAILPRQEATLRFVTLPATDPAEIAAMVRLGVGEWAPYPPEQLEVRHQILARLDTGESRVLVALVHREVIARHVQPIRDAGLELAGLFLSTECLQAASGPSEQPDANAVLSLGEQGLELLVLRDGQPAFSRGVHHTGHWDPASEPDRHALVHELRDAFAAWRRDAEGDSALASLSVAQVNGPAEAWMDLLHEVVPAECVPAPRQRTRSGEPVPLAALGAARLAAGERAAQLDFLPDALHRARAFSRSLQRARGVAAALLVLVLVLLLAFGQAVWQRVALIRELREQARAVAPDVEEITAKRRALDAIAHQVDQGGNVLELIGAVSEAAPAEGLTITRMAYDREAGLDIWGRARSKDLVLVDFLGALRGLGTGTLAQLAQAHSQYETPGEERGQAIVHYQITIPATAVEDRPNADVVPP